MTNLIVEVHDGNVERAIATLKKQMLIHGVFKEIKTHAYYEKPGVRKRRKQGEARKKERKRMRPMIEHERWLDAQGRR